MASIFDDPATFADDALDGFVAANARHVARVDGGVLRSTEMTSGQVAVVIGGGSGHYPAFAGLVGPGLAAAAACGNIFSSPAAGQVYRVAKAAQTGGGVLLSYGNYAGDVLHFGQAQQRLRTEGIDTRTVLVTDDIASAPVESAGKRRGIAGDLTVFKIAGAAAEAGADLDEVERLARKANDRTRSIGVAFAGCTLPGADGPLFTVPAGKMALGLGIHGEPGISEHDMPTASELADLLVDTLLGERPAGAGNAVVPILNGLGAVKYDELFLLYGKIETRLRAAGLTVVEPECGELVTSLDMSGLSLTLFWPDEELAPLWSAPADTPAFRRGNTDPRPLRDTTAIATESAVEEQGTPASIRAGQLAGAVLRTVARVVADNEDEWGRLDAVAGDGDHGIGMRRGADAADAAAGTAVEAGVGVRSVLTAAGEAWSERAGGTSGALWGTGLIAAGAALGNAESYGPSEVAVAASAFGTAIRELGGAQPGDKTMVDALVPFVETLARSTEAGTDLPQALSDAAAAAVRAARATADLRPKLGRARPLAEKSVGHADPGATSFARIAAALSDALPAISEGK